MTPVCNHLLLLSTEAAEALFSEALFSEALFSEALFSEALFSEALFSEGGFLAESSFFAAESQRSPSWSPPLNLLISKSNCEIQV